MQKRECEKREIGLFGKMDSVIYTPSLLSINKLKAYLSGVNNQSAGKRVRNNSRTAQANK